MKSLSGVLLLSWHLLAHSAAPEIPADAIRVLKETHRQFALKSIAAGKLRPGGAHDVVAVIREEDESGGQEDRPLDERTLSYRIVMLGEKENEKGRYVLWRETQQMGELRDIYEFAADIRNGSLYLHISSSRPGTTVYDFQFKYTKGIFRLVGAEGDMSSSVEGEGDLFLKTSVNFLTGVRKDVTTKVLNGKRSVVNKRSPFSLPPMTLEKFDLQSGLAPALDN